jgi:hypothetical protein
MPASSFPINRTAAGLAARIEQARSKGLPTSSVLIKTSAPELHDQWAASMIIGRRHSA